MELLTRSEEIVLMTIWRLQDNAYGVAIRKDLAKVTGKTWSVGAIYAPLHRLEKNGYVKTRMGNPVPERGGRRKVYYELTCSGKQALMRIKAVHDFLWRDAPSLDLKRE